MSARSVFLMLLLVVMISFFLVFINPKFDGIKRLIELAITGRLEVAGVEPEIIAVYLEDNYCDIPGGAEPPRVSPLQNSNRPIRFNATVYDINGDCNGGVTFYICANETAVSPIYCDIAYALQSINVPTPYAQYGGSNNNLYCNYTTTYDLQYFRKCGNWYVNVTAFDTSSKSNSTVRWWRDNMLLSVWYPYVNGVIGDLIYMGTVNLGQWNNGVGQNTTKNTGNINVTSLSWNATNFTSGANEIPIIPFEGQTTFAIDDDTNRMNGAGYISEVHTTQTNFPSYGLYRCEDAACNEVKAMYPLWWHIYVPGVASGVYENVIQYNISTAMSCD